MLAIVSRPQCVMVIKCQQLFYFGNILTYLSPMMHIFGCSICTTAVDVADAAAYEP